MKLLERYALETGLKIKSQFLLEKFFPLPCEKYITIQSGSGQAAKNYPYFKEVIYLLNQKHILKLNDIKIVVLGGKDDQQFEECINLNGQTNLHQSNYILRNSLLHITNDSWTAHRAGFLGVPLISLYGSTTVKNHAPYDYDEKKTVFLESHRNNKNASYQPQEFPQTISLISPEEIANHALKLLGFDLYYGHKSLFFGNLFNNIILELVPNCILPQNFNLTAPLILRADYHFDQNFIFQNLQIRKCVIISKQTIDINQLLQFKNNVAGFRLEIDENVNFNWIKDLIRTGIPASFYTTETDSEKLSNLRLKFFDLCTIEQIVYSSKENFIEGAKQYLNDPNFSFTNNLDFKSGKFILSNNQVFLSKAHLDQNEPVNSLDYKDNKAQIIDSPEFWKDLNSFYIYN